MQLSAGYPFRHWSVASSRTVLANRVLKVRQDTCVIPASGGALEYFVLELADWVNVVPVTSARELVMVRQYRHATRGITLEVPAGSVKENEVPADAARRELLEETGYAAGNLIHLGTWECNPALQTNRLHTFLGLDVEKVAEPAAELDERLEVMTGLTGSIVPLATASVPMRLSWHARMFVLIVSQAEFSQYWGR